MTIRRVVTFATLFASGLLSGVAQGQANIVQWLGEPSTVQNPAGTHQLPGPAGCTLPGNSLAPVPTCVTQGQSLSPISMEVTAGGQSTGVAFTWSSGTLPHGLGINATSGIISGTPDKAGVYSFVITATHAQTVVNSIVYTMAVGTGTTPSLPSITPTALPNTATSGTAVPSNWYTAAATGGYPCVTSSSINTAFCPTNNTTPYYNWSFSSGTNADGMSINATTGAITGTPLSGGTFTWTIQATDGLGQAATPWTTTVTIGGAANFTIITGVLPSGTVGTAYTPTINTQGGLTPMTFAVVAGNLPPGVPICTPSSINCVFSGTPTVAGTYNFSIQASYNNGSTVNSNIQPFTVAIAQASGSTLGLTSPNSQSVALGQSVNMTFTATGGTPPYTYTQLAGFGNFPPGLSLNSSNGALTGTTTATGAYTFTVEVTDATTAHAAASGTFSVGNTLSLPTPASQTVATGQSVAMQFTASGGVAPYTYIVSAGGLPPNLGINSSTGLVSGTISSSASGAYPFTVQVTDSTSNIATAASSITVSASSTFTLPAPSPATVASGQSTSLQFSASGGSSPYTYSITGVTFNGGAITLPSGMTISSSSGLVTFATTSSTPGGAYVVTVQAADSASHTTTAQGSITVNAVTLSLPTPTAVSGLVGQSLTMTFAATGGTPPYTYARASGAFPSGVTLNSSTGVLSGSPTAAGTYTFTVTVTDSASSTATTPTAASITVTAALSMATPAPVNGVNNTTLTMQFTATGGTTPYTYSITSVTLNNNTITQPSQMTINSATGLVSFATTSATLAGPYGITVRATDSASPQGTTTATGVITVGPALTMTNPPAILNGVVGQPVSMQFTATGGTPPYTYAFVGGNLPQGLTLNTTTGLVSGTPTAQGNYGFTIQATDSATPALTATASGNIVLTNLSLNNSNVTISLQGAGGSGIAPNTQPPVTISIAAPLTQDIQGTLGVSFIRTFDNAQSREVSFPNGQTVTFKIPAGSTTASFAGSSSTQLKVGTAVGNGQIQASFQDSLGNNITPGTLQPVQFSVNATPPVINCTPKCGFTLSLPVAATGTTPGGTYTATIEGYSDTLGVSSVTFNFTPTSGTQLSNTSVTVNVQSAFQAWYGNSGSNSTGGGFQLTIPLNFTVSGGSQSNPIAGATVTLTNSQGSVTSPTVVPQ